MPNAIPVLKKLTIFGNPRISQNCDKQIFSFGIVNICIGMAKLSSISC